MVVDALGEFDPEGTACRAHAAAAAARPGSPRTAAQTAASRSRRPRGRAARPPNGSTRPGRGRPLSYDVAQRIARARRHGRRRAAARLARDGYAPPPGWRARIAAGWRVVVDQVEALRLLDGAVDDQEWRSDKRASWTQMLHRMVCCMDWETGLITALTAEKIGLSGDRAERTVSRLVSWARETGVLVVVEHAASAVFLGGKVGRTPTYALVTQQPAVADPAELVDGGGDPAANFASPQLSLPVDTFGDLPQVSDPPKPLNGTRLNPTTPLRPQWPVYGVPETAEDRNDATSRVLRDLGIEASTGLRGAPLWRARMMLHPWWLAGACPAAIAWAIDHHPDRPDRHRGDALRGARDPLAVLGARLRPWDGRLAELPAHLVGFPGNYVARRHHHRAAASTAAAELAEDARGGIPGAPVTPSAVVPAAPRTAAHQAAVDAVAALSAARPRVRRIRPTR